jgi:hypothetical protein
MAEAYRLPIGCPLTMARESSGGFTNMSLATINHKVGWVFQWPYTEAITTGIFRYGARTTTPPQHTISLQSVDTSTGLPTGTILGGGSPVSATFTPPADTTWDGTVRSVAFTNSYTPGASGEYMALVIDATSAPSSGSSSFTRNISTVASYLQSFPKHDVNTGSWAKGGNDYEALFAVSGATRVYGLPVQALTTETTSTSGRRLAMKFTLPSGWGSTFKIIGFRTIGTTPVSSSAPVIGVWDAAGTALQSRTLDGDIIKSAGAGHKAEYFFTGTLATLDFGTTYYIGIQSAGVAVDLINLVAATSGQLAAYPLPACYSLWNGSAWSDTATYMPWVELLIDDWTEPAGGGGGSTRVIGG